MRSALSLFLFLFLFCSVPIGMVVLSSAVGRDADPKAGEEVHRKLCLRCHGEQGRGDGPASKFLKIQAADWTDPERMAAFSDDELFRVIKEGGEAIGRSRLMPGFASKLTGEEIRDVIAFIETLQQD
jgi:mono/diheme cytochrome c family protein